MPAAYPLQLRFVPNGLAFSPGPPQYDTDQRPLPGGTINTIGEMFEDSQVKARGLRIELHDFEGNAIPGVRTPIVMSQTPLRYDSPSPRLGQHTDEVLAELERLEKNR